MDVKEIIDYLNEGEEISFRKEPCGTLTISATDLNKGVRKSVSLTKKLINSTFDAESVVTNIIYVGLANVRCSQQSTTEKGSIVDVLNKREENTTT